MLLGFICSVLCSAQWSLLSWSILWFCLWKMLHALDCSLCPNCASSSLSCLRWAQATGYIQDMNPAWVYTGTWEAFQVSFLLFMKFHLLLCLLLLPELAAFTEPIISKHCCCLVISRAPHCMDEFFHFEDHFTLLNTWVACAILWQIIIFSCNSPWLTLVFTSLRNAYHEETSSHSPLP